MTSPIRPLTAEEIASDHLLALLWSAAEVDDDALRAIRDEELPRLEVIGVVDATPRGFAAFERHADRLELHYIAVDERSRGAGMGARLIAAVCDHAPSLPLAAETDDDAVAFYRALGFAVTDAARDARWPDRPRYSCTLDPRRPSASGPERTVDV